MRSTVLATLLLAAPLARAQPLELGRDARTGLALTVYAGRDLALVRDVRRAELPAGEHEVRFGDVPERLDPRTLALRAAEGAPVTVREQSWRWDLASTDTLLARWIGREVELVETDERLRTRVTPATLLRADGGLVVRIGDRLVPDPPGRLRLPPTGDEVFPRPTLRWRLGVPAAGARQLEATYATGGLGWSADYVAMLDAAETSVALTAWVTVTNASGTRFDDASLALVSGEVHRAAPVEPAFQKRAMPMAMAAPAPASDGVAETAVSEYQRYAFDRRVDLAPGTTTQLPLLAAEGVAVEKRYEVAGGPRWYRTPVAGDDRGERVPVGVVMVLANTAANHLGRSLPAGVVRFWARDAGGAPALVGEDRLPHLPADDRAELALGTASDVVAFRQQTDWKKLDVEPWQYEAAFRVTLRNATDGPVTVRIREPVDGQWRLVESSLPAEKADARTVAFRASVPARGETVVTWRVQVGR